MINAIVSTSDPILLVGGGEVDQALLTQAMTRFGHVVAADGGADAVLGAGGLPDAVIGDLDSLSEAARARLSGDILHRIDEQDSTDFDKCLRNLDAPMVVAMGFLGRRVDHQLAAFTVLARYASRPCLLIGAVDVVALCPPRLSLALAAGTRVSLWPVASVSGRSQGLHWPIEGTTFAPWDVVGTSNRAHGPVTLEMDAAGMLLVLPVDQAEVLQAAIMAAPRWPA
ncbi:thiamine diphosphokinase [Roseivivax sp. CAU 1753]